MKKKRDEIKAKKLKQEIPRAVERMKGKGRVQNISYRQNWHTGLNSIPMQRKDNDSKKLPSNYIGS